MLLFKEHSEIGIFELSIGLFFAKIRLFVDFFDLLKIYKKILENFLTFFRKPLDKVEIYAIILYCIIIAFIMGEFCPFLGKSSAKCPKTHR